jgi:serine/threonine protein phosphatase PrpC
MLTAAMASESYPGGGHDRVDLLIGDGACALIIADGMGGRSGAAAAAQMWIDAARGGSQDPAQWADSDYWLDLMAAADRAIRDAPAAGETTAVVAVMTSGGLCGASVGDSGAWLIGDSDYIDLTTSQTRKPGLGSGMATPIPFYRKHPIAGTVLVATDGLLKYASPQKICQTVRAASRAAAKIDALPAALIDVVRMPSGGLQDDVAVAAARAADS